MLQGAWTSSPIQTTPPIILTASEAPALSPILKEAGPGVAEQFPGADPQVENSSSDLGIEDRISEKATIALTNRVPTSRSALPSTPRRPTGPATVQRSSWG